MNRHRPATSGRARFVKSSCYATVSIAVSAVLISATAADQPDVIYINGTVRDFLKSHPDFNITSGTGHVANNVVLTSVQNRPEFTGAGFEVGSQWKNKSSDEIAPHLYFTGSSLMLGGELDMGGPPHNPPTMDSWNSKAGTYGGDNAGGDWPPIEENATMPDVFPPTGLPPAVEHGNQQINDDLQFGAGSTIEITESLQCGRLHTGQNVTLEISPNSTVIIYATNGINLGQNNTIHVPESSNLHIYFEGGMSIGQYTNINMLDPLDPNRTIITNLDSGTLQLDQHGEVCAHLISPYGKVQMDQGNALYGTLIADELGMDQGASLHWDIVALCGNLLADETGSASIASTADITSSETFDEWFSTVLGTNLAYIHTLALIKNAHGIYEYHNDAFFPIDDMLFGNEGDEHNFNFTYTFKADFVHEQCAERFFEFRGADDAWVYIDDQLVLDLGGIMAGQRQVIEIDRLGLEDGETYTLHFYYAQRNPFTSVFHVSTDLPLESHPPGGVSVQYD